MSNQVPQNKINTPQQVLFASLVGTAVEFFDFYIYATAAVLVFPHLFFPATDPGTSTLASLATFGVAFVARPIGSAIFGHFGDRIGRKRTLVLALSTMGISTFVIGVVPSYQAIGLAALPQLGAPLGFVLSGGIFLALSHWLTNEQFFAWGWRLPFLASAVLVLLGLYVRLSITETPVFQAAAKRAERAGVPMFTVFRHHLRLVVAGVFVCLATFTLFYLMTVFALSWGTTALHYDRGQFLILQLIGILFFAITIPISAWLAERGRRPVMFGVTVLIGAFGLVLEPLFTAGQTGALAMMIIGLALMGFTYGPLGTVVSELFPTNVRYTGSSLAFSLAGILGASLAPYVATWLATHYGLQYVGYYLTATAAVSFVGLLMIRETKDYDLDAVELLPEEL